MTPVLNWKAQGVTLLELLMVLVVLGVITALAYPSYQDHVRRAHRLEAQSTMQQAAHHLQRRHVATYTYETAPGANPLPAELRQSPSQGRAQYTLTLSDVSANDYVLTATPTSSGAMHQDPCGSLTLNAKLIRGITGTGANVQQCWR